MVELLSPLQGPLQGPMQGPMQDPLQSLMHGPLEGALQGPRRGPLHEEIASTGSKRASANRLNQEPLEPKPDSRQCAQQLNGFHND